MNRTRLTRGLAYGVCAAAFVFSLAFLPTDRRPAGFDPQVLADWVGCCRWISAQTPQQAQVLTPSYGWAFKWHSGRAEYVNHKDCPQDALSLLEWKRRYDLLRKWEAARKLGSMSRRIVSQFADRERVDFILAPKNETTDLPVVHRGRYFWVYDVRRL